MTVQSYKPYARAISFVSAVIIIIASLDASQVIQLFPEYANTINTILVLAGLIAPVLAQEKRVSVAEELVHQEYENDDGITVNLTLDGEDILSDDDSTIDEVGDDEGV